MLLEVKKQSLRGLYAITPDGVGAVSPSPTKPLAARTPLSRFGRCRNDLGVPVCAIGGITLDNEPALLSAGADLLAVITDLLEASDIESRALAFQPLFEGERA